MTVAQRNAIIRKSKKTPQQLAEKFGLSVLSIKYIQKFASQQEMLDSQNKIKNRNNAANPERERARWQRWNASEKHKEQVRQYRKRHRRRILKAARQRYAENIEQRRAQQRAWAATRRQQTNQRVHQWYLANKKKTKRRVKRWAAKPKNREKINAWQRERYAANPKKYNDAARRRRMNPDVVARQNKMRRRWAKANPEKVAANAAIVSKRHKMRKRQAYVGCQQADAFMAWTRGRKMPCYWCGEICRVATIEHVQPLLRGGLHEIGNLQLACYSCNASKGGKTATEFIAYRREQGRVVALDDSAKRAFLIEYEKVHQPCTDLVH